MIDPVTCENYEEEEIERLRVKVRRLNKKLERVRDASKVYAKGKGTVLLSVVGKAYLEMLDDDKESR